MPCSSRWPSFLTEENVTSVFLLTPTGKKSPSGQDIYQVSRRDVTMGVSDVNNVEVTTGLCAGDTHRRGKPQADARRHPRDPAAGLSAA